MKVLVDAFGGDNAPLEIIKGCILCLEKYDDLEIGLVGNKNIIEKKEKKNSLSIEGLEIHNASDVITMEDEAGEIVKSKSESSDPP